MFKILEHTGDAAVLFKGSSLVDMLNYAIAGFNEIIGIPPGNLGRATNVTECLDFVSWVDLPVDLFNRFIYLFDTDNFLAIKIEGLLTEGNRICFNVRGRIARSKSSCRNVIKAATYHNVRFDPSSGEGFIVFDL
ncbi:MAG: archease [Thermoplasmataceae archaeon]